MTTSTIASGQMVRANGTTWERLGDRVVRAVVFALFFTSGFAALLYQVIWQRVLAIFSGADVYSITIIVAAFMAGLGCGSLVGGYVADRVSVGRRIVLFALAELAVAAFAFASLWLYYDVLYLRLSHLAGSPALLAVVLFVSLLWPTFFMGMSLPLLARAMTRRVESAAGVVGALYGFNTLGAAVGALLTTWVFMRTLGFEGTVQLGAALNACAAVGALLVAPYFLRDASAGGARGAGDTREAPAAPAEPAAAADATGFSVPVWTAIYGLSGFVALSLEIVWFRLLGVMLKSTAFTFGTLLSIYLAGLTVGTFAGLRWARRSERPALIFLGLQAGVSVYAGLTLVLLIAALGHSALVEPLWSYLGAYEPLDVRASLSVLARYVSPSGGAVMPDEAYMFKQFLMLHVAVPLVVTGPPTVMMGLSFPFLQRMVQRDVAVLGRRVGWLQTANIFGSMLGASLTGWVLLRVLGTAATVRVLVLIGAFFLALVLVLHAGRRGRASRVLAAGAAAAIVGVVAVAWLIPGSTVLWATLHGSAPDAIIAAEDGSGLSVLRRGEDGWAGETTVYANGLGQSHIPFPTHHVTLGLVPVMLHPDPREIAIVGLGSGATLYAAGGRHETRRISSIEIVAPQLETLRRLNDRRRDGGLASLLSDDRIAFTFADARTVIRLGGEKYDVIEADALRPTSAYAGNLYSVEYFTLLREHLKPRGFAVSWAPTQRVIDTFVSVFPHAMLYEHEAMRLLIGSNEPIAWNQAGVGERLRHEFTRAYYARAGVDVERYLQEFASATITLFDAEPGRATTVDLNTDLFPRDEFLVPRSR